MTEEQAKLIKQIAEDYNAVLKEAKSMGCKNIKALYNIPIENMELIVQALEKQTPEIPAYEGDGYDQEGNIIFDEWLCPCCNARYEVDYDEYDFCPYCGQSIDWSEQE